ncbi:MAG: hypothetical protein ACMUIA_06620 [bacterium]
MTPDEIFREVQEAFRDVCRPEEFVRGTCSCDECLEHNQTLAAHTPDNITMNELGNPGWDPMCFANDQAFAYYLPAMVRLAFEEDAYVDQLLFHLNSPGRLEILNDRQERAILDALWLLVDIQAARITWDLDYYSFDEAIKKLER